ncbi:hypothetical protein IIA95_02630 [Patescibacteria group bacterium]|nr:hypothetical protein [Patescibacteria group bacterium]
MNDYSASIHSITQQLPKPDAVYRSQGKDPVVFEVYKAKGFESRFWRDPFLRELLLRTRGSYRKYGAREPIDQYDSKASIYLVRAMYPSDDGIKIIEEWLSSRLVPGIGNPQGAGELDIYFYQERPMDYWVREHLGCRNVSFWNYVLSSSRMCGIHPFVAGSNGEQTVNYRLKHKYTAACNAIIRAQFLINNAYQFPYKVVTAIIREDLHEKGLLVEVEGKKFMPLYTKAHDFLGIVDPHAIKLNRSVYAYEFPSYWLDVSRLVSLLECLQKEGKLSEEALGYYLKGESIPFDFNPSNLGLLLAVDGKIHASTMTGNELRGLVDKYVQEKPILRITDAKKWFGSYLRVLDVMEIDIFTQNPELAKFL